MDASDDEMMNDETAFVSDRQNIRNNEHDGDSAMRDANGTANNTANMKAPPRRMSSASETGALPQFELNQRVLCCDSRQDDPKTNQSGKNGANDEGGNDGVHQPDPNAIYYPAIIRKVMAEGTEWRYYIHYQGWNARWDHWVDSSALVGDTPDNRKLYISNGSKNSTTTTNNNNNGTSASVASSSASSHTISKSASISTFSSPNGRARVSSPQRHPSPLHSPGGDSRAQDAGRSSKASPARKRKTGSAASSNKRTQRKRGGANLASSSLHNLWQDYCELPLTLKTVLVDDLEAISPKQYDVTPFTTGQYSYANGSLQPIRKVHVLPASVTVRQVLQQYQKKRGGSKAEPQKRAQVQSFCKGLGDLFESALPACLLYPQERPQYEHIVQSVLPDSSKSVCDVYGCIFLLRLFIRLPLLLSEASLTFLDVTLSSGNHYSNIDSSSGRFIDPSESISNEIQIIGPMIVDLMVLLQKNHTACFPRAYRYPQSCELAVWERHMQAGASSIVDAREPEQRK